MTESKKITGNRKTPYITPDEKARTYGGEICSSDYEGYTSPASMLNRISKQKRFDYALANRCERNKEFKEGVLLDERK